MHHRQIKANSDECNRTLWYQVRGEWIYVQIISKNDETSG